jgi:hypothetical protein
VLQGTRRRPRAGQVAAGPVHRFADLVGPGSRVLSCGLFGINGRLRKSDARTDQARRKFKRPRRCSPRSIPRLAKRKFAPRQKRLGQSSPTCSRGIDDDSDGDRLARRSNSANGLVVGGWSTLRVTRCGICFASRPTGDLVREVSPSPSPPIRPSERGALDRLINPPPPKHRR